MSRITRSSHSRRMFVTTGLVLIGLAATAATPRKSMGPAATFLNRIPTAAHCVFASVDGERAKSAYFAELTGVGADGRDMVWHGAVAGAAVGELTVRLAHEGRDIDTSNPTWPVEGIVIVSGEDPQRAFAADVHGTIDWRTKRVMLAGDVSVGNMRGAHVEETADLIDLDLSGELRIAPATSAFARSGRP
jgi:hypothetical protein